MKKVTQNGFLSTKIASILLFPYSLLIISLISELIQLLHRDLVKYQSGNVPQRLIVVYR